MEIQRDLFRPVPTRSPVVAAYGAGVDSTAMILEMLSRGEPIDQVLMADTNSENYLTVEYAAMFGAWLRERNVPFEIVRTEVKRYGDLPLYVGLFESNLVNGTLPTISFGFSACSQRWKLACQDKWINRWEPAASALSHGFKTIKLVGFDCSPADAKRYAEREGHDSEKYILRYPLREWGWTRDDCIARIKAEGLPVPVKSACTMCLATKPHELHAFTQTMLRRIVLLEMRAMPKLTTVGGLWRKEVLGKRGSVAHPAAMTTYIKDQGLLPETDIDHIREVSTVDFAKWLAVQKRRKLENREPVAQWLKRFDDWTLCSPVKLAA